LALLWHELQESVELAKAASKRWRSLLIDDSTVVERLIDRRSHELPMVEVAHFGTCLAMG